MDKYDYLASIALFSLPAAWLSMHFKGPTALSVLFALVAFVGMALYAGYQIHLNRSGKGHPDTYGVIKHNVVPIAVMVVIFYLALDYKLFNM